MKKWILLLLCVFLTLLCVTALADVAINEENFPDAGFREVVSLYDLDQDAVLSNQEIAAVRELDCSYHEIGDLTGVQVFTSLKELHCQHNALTALNVRSNSKLTYLDCTGNRLGKLDVSKNKLLVTLWCTENEFTSLNLSANTALKQLGCASNKLTTLSVSKNTKLSELYCNDNKITRLDLTACPLLAQTIRKADRINSGDGFDYWTFSGNTVYTDSNVTVTAGSTVSKPTDAAETVTVKGGVYKVGKAEAVLLRVSKNSLTSLEIRDTVTNSKGKKIKVTSIAPNACYGMQKLKKVKIGANVKQIGNCAFASCPKLTTVSGGKAVVSYGDSTFSNCRSLSSFVITVNVKKIGTAAFADCVNLKKITVQTTKLKAGSIGDNAFGNTSKKAVVICPAKQLKTYKKIFVQKGLYKKATFK